jgi:hypothetical protein
MAIMAGKTTSEWLKPLIGKDLWWADVWAAIIADRAN